MLKLVCYICRHSGPICVTTVSINNTSAMLVANWDPLMKIPLNRYYIYLHHFTVHADILCKFSCTEYLKSIQLFTALKVFPCSASNCGHFYHPKCVARLLCADDQIKAEELQAKIAARDYFACPLHICKVCNMSEDKNQLALHFAVCRRCPTAYHRKCLPR